MVMQDLLPSAPLLVAFLIASLVLAVTPGPGVLYIVTRTLAQGRRAGLASVGGVAAGNLGNALAAAVGLAALFAASALAFTIVKYAGGAYLIYLGIQALRAHDAHSGAHIALARPRAIFRDGLVVALLNPKTTIFFAAFLPQFMHPGTSAMKQAVALGVLFVLIAALTDTLYALCANAIAPALLRMHAARRAGRYATAMAFIGLGVFAALSEARQK